MTDAAPILCARGVRKVFHRSAHETVVALEDVDFEVARGSLSALVGPDGGGKTTLLRLACGLLSCDGGSMHVLGFDASVHPQEIQDRIAYMPQRFGLYEDLTVKENIDLYADLHGVSEEERSVLFPRLMEMTALGKFQQRLAGALSGGMKQKLGLACALVHAPELMLLDEPTAGVDPLSRHELWEIILDLVARGQTTVLLSTSYLDEAARCTHVGVLHNGAMLAQGRPGTVSELARGRVWLIDPPLGEPPRNLQAQLLDDPETVDAVPEAGRVRLITAASAKEGALAGPQTFAMSHKVTRAPAHFEDGFMVLLRGKEVRQGARAIALEKPIPKAAGQAAIEVRDLVRKFGAFSAVDGVSFVVRRGELFGLLGPNGAGKTTTFRMLCGLLPATSGTLRVAGADLRTARAAAREHIGYVAQKFSLYGELSVEENLEFFASVYNLRGARKRERIDWALEQFELQRWRRLAGAQLPGGFKQRLAMAVALLHQPQILFLDEPTSGADPIARREFWRRITALAVQGVTVVITTHFMEEAEYCDRVAILDQGQLLAQGAPGELRALGRRVDEHEPSMEDAFIAIVEKARRNHTPDAATL